MEPLFQIKVKCHCCESSFQTSRVRPSLKRAIRSDSDFCSYFKEVNPDFYVVRVCPYCGFASTENFNEHLPDKLRKTFFDQVGSKWQHKDYGGERTEEEAMECYKLSLLSAQITGEKDRVIAGLLHHIAWLFRYKGDIDQENRFLGYALNAYISVFQTERESLSNARLMFLIGDLHRRLGNFNDAVKWFGRVIHDRSITDAAMIRSSREQWQNIREEMTGRGMELPEEMQLSGT